LVNDPKGVFELRGVAPGAYSLYAFLYDAGRGELARQPIEVAETDLDGITLTVAPGVNIKGRLRASVAQTSALDVCGSSSDSRLWTQRQTADH
jgi:hypothetical protein